MPRKKQLRKRHMEKERRLDLLNVGDGAEIIRILPGKDIRRRLLDVGFTKGTRVECVGKSPFGDPSAYLVRGTVMAIRNADAASVMVTVE